MTLPTTGPISLGDLQTEFNSNSPVSLGDFYRGGPIVNEMTRIGNGAFQTAPLVPGSGVQIPQSGPIQFSQFFGVSKWILGTAGYRYPVNVEQQEYHEILLPATVDLITFHLLGGAGGAGGPDSGYIGGNGGAGAYIAGTISTAAFGPTNVDRYLRIFVGSGGKGGIDAPANGLTHPAPGPYDGFAMLPSIPDNDWGWQRTENLAVAYDSEGGYHLANHNFPLKQTIYFPETGNYTFEFTADEHARIYIDDVEVANTYGDNSSSYNGSDSFSFTTPLLKTVSISEGLHKLKLTYFNSGSAGGVALRIRRPNNDIIWQTSDNYTGNRPFHIPSPLGGYGGYPGVDNDAGQGGAGGSATALFLVYPSNPHDMIPIAVAGGGGGGGGSALRVTSDGDYYTWKHGNWCNQGITISPLGKTLFRPGDPGEYADQENRGDGTYNVGASDAAGGGGGGGGVKNNRMYYVTPGKMWEYSGFGGRTARGYPGGTEFPASGGENGKSFLSSVVTPMTDFIFTVSNNRTPLLPANAPVGFESRLGGEAGLTYTSASDGASGVAFVSWGYHDGTDTPTVVRPNVTCRIVPYTTVTRSTEWSGGVKTWIFSLDAFGGGGKPGTDYTYSWSYGAINNANATQTIVNSSLGRIQLQVNVNETALGNANHTISGSMSCVVTDENGATGTSSITWTWAISELWVNPGGA